MLQCLDYEKVLQYGREALISEGFFETHTPKIVATATEGGTDLFPMQYFDTPAFLNQSPQLFKQLCMSGGLERVFEIGRHLELKSMTLTDI